MKNAAIILATLSIIILSADAVEAADFKIDTGKNFVELRRFTPPIPIPRRDENRPPKFYMSRYPMRPKPHYLPTKSKPSRDNRGGGRRNFSPPQAPFK